MGKIRVLSPQTANKIAAGEVVERPASVVKELVENSLDAGATQIEVIVEKGGMLCIEVRDNGCGLTREDAVLAFERHATSKVADDEDLSQITTLGFRGEALPSIAAVSKLELTSRVADEIAGTKVVLEGGTLRHVEVSGCPVGTTVVVRDLFFNTPARRKFLSSAQAEARRIMEVFRKLALSHTEVAFRLVRNGTLVTATTGTSDLSEVVGEFFGADYIKKTLSMDYHLGNYRVYGLIGDLALTYHNRTRQYVFVNGRCVNDSTICHALEQAFRNRIPSGRFPVAFVFLEVPPDQVDVNVHPAKHEVRFADRRQVHRLVTLAVQEALNKKEHQLVHKLTQRESAAVREQTSYYNRELPLSTENSVSVFNQSQSTLSTDHLPTQTHLQSDSPLKQVTLLGQCHNSYIVAETREGLVLIDQHAAHERVIYAELLRLAQQHDKRMQQLVLPVTVNLSLMPEYESQLITTLRDIGFSLEPFGKNTFIVRALPDFLAASLGRDGIQSFLEAVLDEVDAIERIRDTIFKQLSCKAAIKAKQPLSRDEMIELIGRLVQTRDWRTCPHGRPTTWLIEISELNKRFMR